MIRTNFPIRFSVRTILVSGLAIVLFGLTGVAQAQTIRGCVNNSNGKLRILVKNSCTEGESE